MTPAPVRSRNKYLLPRTENPEFWINYDKSGQTGDRRAEAAAVPPCPDLVGDKMFAFSGIIFV